MAGFDNDILNCIGERLEPSTAQAITIAQETDSVSILNVSGTPESAVSANPASLACDRTNGTLYVKDSGTSNTGWQGTVTASAALNTNGVTYGTGVASIASTTSAANSILSTNGSSVPSLGTSLDNDYTFTSSTASSNRILTVTNTDNTSNTSIAIYDCVVGGTSAGSPFYRTVIGSTVSYCMGPDNTTTNDPWRLRHGPNATVTPQSGGSDATLIQVEPTGEVTKPKNPTVYAEVGTTLTSQTGDGTVVNPVIFNNEYIDLGADYDTTTGLFTVPITGRYLISAFITYNDLTASHTAGEIRIVSSGGTTRNLFNPGASRDVNNQYTAHVTAILPCTATNTVGIYTVVSGSTKVVDFQGNNFGIFTGLSINLIS